MIPTYMHNEKITEFILVGNDLWPTQEIYKLCLTFVDKPSWPLISPNSFSLYFLNFVINNTYQLFWYFFRSSRHFRFSTLGRQNKIKLNLTLRLCFSRIKATSWNFQFDTKMNQILNLTWTKELSSEAALNHLTVSWTIVNTCDLFSNLLRNSLLLAPKSVEH